MRRILLIIQGQFIYFLWLDWAVRGFGGGSKRESVCRETLLLQPVLALLLLYSLLVKN